MSSNAPLEANSDVHVTNSMEDYLKAAYRLEQDGGAITTQRLAEALALSQPSVTNMVKRLDELNLVVHSRYHGVELTTAGRKVALEVIRHHRLLELYLSQALGYNLDAVHAEAERLEHHISEEFETRMEAALGFPEFDPHGDPIPDRDGRLPHINDRALTDMRAGDKGTVSRVSDRDAQRLATICALGISPGVGVVVTRNAGSESPVTVVVNGIEQTLSENAAAAVRVTRETP
jgi:DtxR family Mn-dependent transcriptional regulator